MLYFHRLSFTLTTVGRRYHIEGGQFHPGSGLGHVTRVIWRFIYLPPAFLFASLTAVVDRNMDTVYSSNSPTWVLQRLSLLSDCCNDNLGPVICTLQFPSSTSACIFDPLRRPWPDSHLRWEFLLLLLIYSSIMAHRSSPHLRDGGRSKKLPHWSLTPSAPWWGHFWEGSSHCYWVFLVILDFLLFIFMP